MLQLVANFICVNTYTIHYTIYNYMDNADGTYIYHGYIFDLCNRGHRYNGLHKDYHGDPADKEMEAVSGVEEDGEE